MFFRSVLYHHDVAGEQRVILPAKQALRINRDHAPRAVNGNGTRVARVLILRIDQGVAEREALVPQHHRVFHGADHPHLWCGGLLELLLHLRHGGLLAGHIGALQLLLIWGFVFARATGQREHRQQQDREKNFQRAYLVTDFAGFCNRAEAERGRPRLQGRSKLRVTGKFRAS